MFHIPRRRHQDQGFSLVEVLLAVLVLGVTGVALLDGLQSNLLQSRKASASTNSIVNLATAVDVLRAAPFVSCASDSQPYAQLPNGLTLPDGISVTVTEFVSTSATPWQQCSQVSMAGAVQNLIVTAPDGSTRSLMRFGSGSPATPPPPPPPTITLAAAATASPKSVCDSFRNSKSNKVCTITITSTAGSGGNWHATALGFPGGSVSNPTPTAAITQGTAIQIGTYLLNGASQCAAGTVIPLTIELVDDGNGTTATVQPVLTC